MKIWKTICGKRLFLRDTALHFYKEKYLFHKLLFLYTLPMKETKPFMLTLIHINVYLFSNASLAFYNIK